MLTKVSSLPFLCSSLLTAISLKAMLQFLSISDIIPVSDITICWQKLTASELLDLKQAVLPETLTKGKSDMYIFKTDVGLSSNLTWQSRKQTVGTFLLETKHLRQKHSFYVGLAALTDGLCGPERLGFVFFFLNVGSRSRQAHISTCLRFSKSMTPDKLDPPLHGTTRSTSLLPVLLVRSASLVEHPFA